LIYLPLHSDIQDRCNNTWSAGTTPKFKDNGLLLPCVVSTPFGKLTGNAKRTVEFFVKKDTATAQQLALAGYGGTADNGSFYPWPGGMLVVGPRNLNSSTVSNIDDGNYHHIAGTYDGSTMVIYVDGIKRGYSNIALATQSTPFYIGHHQHVQVSDAAGVIISDLRVSDIVRYTSDFTAPQRLPSTVALSSDNKVYGYANGTFSKLSDNWATITDKEKITLFTNTNGKQPTIADLQTIGTSCSLMAYTDDDNRQDCKLRALPNVQFIKPKNLINLHAYESITNMSVTSDISTNATLRILVTTDLATYKYFDTASSTWKAVDITDINNVKQYGMSASVMKALTTDNLALLGMDNIGFAYYLEISDITDTCNVDALVLTVNMKGDWNKAVYNTDVTYGYPSNDILKIQILTNGDYKINYNPGPKA
jgi:hypothetical protein